MSDQLLNKILEQIIEVRGDFGEMKSDLKILTSRLDQHEKLHADHKIEHDKIHKRLNQKKDPDTFFNQLVSYTKGIGVISMFLYGLYNIAKQIGLK